MVCLELVCLVSLITNAQNLGGGGGGSGEDTFDILVAFPKHSSHFKQRNTASFRSMMLKRPKLRLLCAVTKFNDKFPGNSAKIKAVTLTLAIIQNHNTINLVPFLKLETVTYISAVCYSMSVMVFTTLPPKERGDCWDTETQVRTSRLHIHIWIRQYGNVL